MIKITSVPNGDHTLRVKSGGTITLDTGFETGTVLITGDLQVQGTTTTVESTDLSIEDNIILLNRGEQGDGITLQTGGIRINRGTLADAFFLFDENISWADPVSATTQDGAFVFRNEDNDIVGIRTTSITTGGEDLYLIGTGTGVISVTGTSAYETRVTDDDHIPNKKYVDDEITSAFTSALIKQISDGTTTVSRVAVEDFETTGNDSKITIDIDGNTVTEVYSDRVEFHAIRIVDTTIETTESNENLILSAPGTGDVVIDDTLHIYSIPGIDDAIPEPDLPTDGVRLYTSSENYGGTGIYFANSDSTRDELISNNRSLLYSMIF